MENKTKKYLDKKSAIFLTILCFLVYTSSYLGKYNYNANFNLIMEHYSVSHSEVGLVATFFFFAYGLGQFIHGALCKKYNERLVIPIVLLLSGIINFAFTKVDNFQYIKFLWLANGCCLAALWPTVSGCLLRNIHYTQRRKAMYVMLVSTRVGILTTYGLSSIFSLLDSMFLAFYVSAILLLVVAVTWFFCYGKIKRGKNFIEYSEQEEAKIEKKTIVTKTGPFVFMIFAILAVVLIQFEIEGLTSWTPTIMKESFGKNDAVSIVCSLVLNAVAIAAPFLIELINKKIKLIYAKLTLIFFVSTIFCALILVGLNQSSFYLTMGSFIAIYLILAMLSDVVSSNTPIILRDKFDSGIITGFQNGFAYVGSTISTYLIGKIVDGNSWTAVFYLYICVLVLLFLFALTLFVLEKVIKQKAIEAE